ncbi:MAG: hypothetical protein A2Z77_06780 [Chloroflexi bacterium RBG_13_51_36]|nr:MAG: hypothetical protein A2Z77_06780 [Chloroflexi bacterium RBG_13_51_36]
MKRKIVLIVVAVLVVVGGVVVGVRASPYRIYRSYIKDVEVFADQYSPPGYHLRVVAGGPNTCWKPWKYSVVRFGNIVVVDAIALFHRDRDCGQAFTWEVKVFHLGRCFVPGMKYVLVVNGEVESFIAGECEVKPMR